MKDFLKYTLATIVGITVVSMLSFFMMIGVMSAIMATSSKDTSIKDNSLLILELDGNLVDRSTNNPFGDLDIPLFATTKSNGLDQIVSAIEKAKTEDKIKGIYIKSTAVGGGYAISGEIRRALADFRNESDKFVYAFSEIYSQNTYYLASVADKVFISPEGMLELSGLSAQASFYKNALDKLGLEMQIIRHGKFKAAVEPFILDHMSDENRKQTETYIGSMWNKIAGDIAQSRNIPIEKLNEICDLNTTYRTTDEYLTYGLVDSVVYEDQMLDILRELTNTKANKGINVHTVADMKNVKAPKKGKGLARDKIAVIYASGEILMESSSSILPDEEGIVGAKFAKEIRMARQDSSIKAIVLRINSPGGSALASELIWREVKLAADEKPLVVSMGNYAASGGYYIACAADTIVANPATITGSIGVFSMIPNAGELLEQKLGINSETVNTNKLSDMPSLTRRLTGTERNIMQNMVEKVYTTFVNRVAEGRNLSYQQVDEIGQGRVWSGTNAKEIGLVDVLGDLQDAIKIAEDLSGLDHYRIVSLPKQSDPIEEMLKSFSGQVKMSILKKELGAAADHYYALKQIQNTSGVLTRLPYGMNIE